MSRQDPREYLTQIQSTLEGSQRAEADREQQEALTARKAELSEAFTKATAGCDLAHAAMIDSIAANEAQGMPPYSLPLSMRRPDLAQAMPWGPSGFPRLIDADVTAGQLGVCSVQECSQPVMSNERHQKGEGGRVAHSGCLRWQNARSRAKTAINTYDGTNNPEKQK